MSGSAAGRLQGLGFEYPRGHGCLSIVSVVCCQVEVSAPGWSPDQRSPTECGVSECVQGTSQSRRGGRGTLGLWSCDKGSYRLLKKHVFIVSRLLNSGSFTLTWCSIIWRFLDALHRLFELHTCSSVSLSLSVCLSEATYRILKLWKLCLYFYAINIH
jgi:hypothetical protein